MKKILFLTMLVIFFSFSSIHAKGMKGKFGLGYEHTIGGANGINLIFWFHKHLSAEIIFGMNFASLEGGNATTIYSALGTRYNFARAKQVNLGIGPRFVFGYCKNNCIAGDSSINFALEVPFIIEYFLTNHFAIHTNFGFVIDIISDKSPVLNKDIPYSETTVFHAFDNSGLMGNLGMTFYF